MRSCRSGELLGWGVSAFTGTEKLRELGQAAEHF